jgi:methionyl-tRNA formyltransferase
MESMQPRYVFAGNREIAVDILTYLLGEGDVPIALVLPDNEQSSHDDALATLFREANPTGPIWRGSFLRDTIASVEMSSLKIDFALSIHFPHIVPREILESARLGWFNLHPSLLPYNRGWHTPSWTILEGTPAGATLHKMSEEIDAGSIVSQREVPVWPEDTAHTLYQRILRAEYQLFKDAWHDLKAESSEPYANSVGAGTHHSRRELRNLPERRLALHENRNLGRTLRVLRALTTNRVEEAAYFEEGGIRYFVQVEITPEE